MLYSRIGADRAPALLWLFLLALLPGLAACPAGTAKPDAADKQAALLDKTYRPPVAAQVPAQIPSPNGTRIDPYAWLRDDTRSKPEVLDYLKAENAYTDQMTAHTKPLQDQLYNEIVSHVQEDDTTVPVRDKGWWYYTRTEKGKEYPVIMRKADATTSGAESQQVMLNGNERAAGLEYFSFGEWEVSPNTELVAWTEDTVGRFTYTIHFKNLVTGEVLPDVISTVDPGIVWADDSTLLYVEKDPVTLLGSRVRKHLLGTEPAADPLVHEESDKSFYIELQRSKSERYVFIELLSTEVSEWRYADTSDPELAFKTFLPREPHHEYQIEHVGSNFIVRTNWQAPNFRLMLTPAPAYKPASGKPAAKQAAGKKAGAKPAESPTDRRFWKPLVAHRGHVFIEDFEVYKNWVAINERSGGLLRLTVKDLSSGREHFIKGDEASCALRLVHTPEFDSDRVRVEFTSLATPKTTYEYDLRSGQQQTLKVEPSPGYDPAQYVTEFVFAPARDGSRIPISLVHRKDFKKNGQSPLLLLGYGSYGYSYEPLFEPETVPLRDRGFVIAIAHVRGGQELGRKWYEEGRLLNKKNTFTDFIDATEYLVREKYAAPGKVFAKGGSAGGLLMGAIANMRPDLYRGVLAEVPFVDVVTTMLDENIPLTTNEYSEWGDPRDKEAYDYMLSYSPYDNVGPQNYPAMLVTTGLWDSQVQYFEPAKWVAKLRANKQGFNPLIFRINLEAGHHGKSGRYQQFREQAFDDAFMLDRAGIKN
jgi:oligopeptidase B